jgi:hypothetical protein
VEQARHIMFMFVPPRMEMEATNTVAVIVAVKVIVIAAAARENFNRICIRWWIVEV